MKGSPTWTWGRLASLSWESSSEAKVAPWMPSRPVRAPTAMRALPTPSASPLMRSSRRMIPMAMAFTTGFPS